MLNSLLSALRDEDFQTAAAYLEALRAQEPESPWVTFGTARLHEAEARWEEAVTLYRQLLRQASNSKLIVRARQGIERIEKQQAERHAAAVAEARNSGNTNPGILVLRAISPANRQGAAQCLAKVIDIDAYTARLQLPSRGLRPIRLGPLGELAYFARSLQAEAVPCFCCSEATISELQVFSALALEVEGERAIARDSSGRELAFARAAVTARVLGEIPIAGEIVKIDPRAEIKTSRQTDTLDYIHLCDLHLPAQKTIVRLCDRYGELAAGDRGEKTSGAIDRDALTRDKWSRLLATVAEFIPETAPVCDDFDSFAGAVKDAIGFYKFLIGLDARIDIAPERLSIVDTADPSRQKQGQLWEAAYMFYSALVMLSDRD